MSPMQAPWVLAPAVSRLAGVSIFLTGALSLALPSGYSIGAVCLLLVGIVGLFVLPKPTIRLPILARLVVVAMFVYALFWMADAALRGEGLREFDRPSRFVFAAICLVALARMRVPQAWFWSGVAAGASAAGGLAIWQKIVLAMDRATGTTQMVQFGNLSMLFGLLCAAGLFWAQAQVRFKAGWISLLATAAALGVIASFLSGTRGAWIALAVSIPVFFLAMNRAGVRKRTLAGVIAAFIVLTSAVYLLPQSGVSVRVGQALTDWQQYSEGDVVEGSVSKRFEMWRGAWQLFREKPMLGWGETGYIQHLGRLGEAGVISQRAAGYTHAHNDLLNVLAKKGIIGGLILYALYILPLVWFAGQFRAGSSMRLGIAVAGVILPLSYMAFGISQVSFNHNSGVMVYAFLLAILMGLSARLSSSHAREGA
ncbi:O-antigen ligase family protein [Spiribacter sp. 221]|uniref:O-antigen ligase family protein n=1 Tax=Spiribacter onubensis TaxID=3122420 RepID=UPI00349FBEEB